jgi:4-hydroxy-2-oxoheptanedioate aldolase
MMPAAGSELAAVLRARLREGRVVWSTFVKLSDVEVVEVLYQSGLDAMVIDMEHSQLSDADARRLVRHAAGLGFPAMVRIPAVDHGVINRLLEAGAAGIQLSSVTSRRQVEELLGACRYPPRGSRSASLAQPDAAYGVVPLPDYLGRDGPFVVGQIESGATEEALPEVIAGLDVVFIGLTDLSVALGAPGRFGDPAVVERVAEVARSAGGDGGPALGGWVPDVEAARTFADGRARYLTVGSDLSYLASAVRSASEATGRLADEGGRTQR